MTNTLQKPSNVENIFNKLNQVHILKVLDRDLQKILFIGDRLILSYLQAHLLQKNPQACLNQIEFDIDNSKYFWQELQAKQKYIANNIETVIIASVKHEKHIYEQINSQLDLKILLLFDDIFINLVTQRNILDSIPANLTPPQTNYCILSTPRSGSTMFCDALTSTGLAGFPREHLRDPSLILAQQGNFDSDRYLKAIKSLHTTQNSVFGTKLISHFIEKYVSLSKGNLNPLDYFDNFIYLIRRDKVAQAVSLFMAQKSGVWKISQAEKLSNYQNKISNKTITKDDLEQVHKLHNRLLKEENYLEQMCVQKNIKPLVVYYEDITTDLSGHIAKLLRCLNIISEENTEQLNITIKEKKLGSQTSQNVIDMYKQEYC